MSATPSSRLGADAITPSSAERKAVRNTEDQLAPARVSFAALLAQSPQRRALTEAQSFAETGMLGRGALSGGEPGHRQAHAHVDISSGTRITAPEKRSETALMSFPLAVTGALRPGSTLGAAPQILTSHPAAARVPQQIFKSVVSLPPLADVPLGNTPITEAWTTNSPHSEDIPTRTTLAQALKTYAAHESSVSLSLTLHAGADGVHIYARTGEMDENQRARLKSGLAILLAAHGIEHATVFLNGAVLQHAGVVALRQNKER